MNTRFIEWPFAASGAPATRTQPARLSDIVNVKDWGALGNNAHDDRANIQAAIDFCLGTDDGMGGTKQPGGIVFFPSGRYFMNGGLNVGSTNPNARIILRGSGQQRGCEIATNNSSGFVISQGAATYDNIQSIENIDVTNVSTVSGTGCIKVTGTAVGIRSSQLTGMVLVDASQANGCSVSDILGEGLDTIGTSDIGPLGGSPSAYPQTAMGILLGNNCIAQNCRLQPGKVWIGYALSGYGAAAIGCSCENVTIGVRIGWGWVGGGLGANYGEVAAVGCLLQGHQTEKNDTAVELYNAQGCIVQSNWLFGNQGLPTTQNLTMSWAAGTVTCNTSAAAAPHNLGAGFTNSPLEIVSANANFTPTVSSSGYFQYCTYASSTSFTYSLAADPGAPNPTTGTWQYGLHYTIRVRKASECALIGNILGERASVAELDLGYDNDANTVQASNIFYANGGGTSGWLGPTTTRNLAGWKFLQSGSTSQTTNSVASPANLAGVMTVNDLPGNYISSGVYQPGPMEGQEYDIRDCTVTSSGNFATIVSTGGGANHVKVRYDGTNWRISG